MAKEVRSLIGALNDAHAAQHGADLFKATNKTASAQSLIGETVTSYDQYKTLIGSLYFLLWEGPGSKLPEKPQSFVDVNTLRTELEHDTDHGKDAAAKKKKVKHAETFGKYAGSTSPALAAPARFPLLQLSLLKAVRADLYGLKQQYH